MPDESAGPYVAVVEEGLLHELLPALAASATAGGSTLQHAPAAVVALPGANNTAFSPAPQRPLEAYYLDGDNVAWNPSGLDLLKLALPCAVFLARTDMADDLRSKGRHNVQRGWNGPLYFGDVQLDTRMDLTSTSLTCLEQQQCLPLGGSSVWASMPPLQPTGTAPAREQVWVMTHWDSQGLFRSAIAGATSALSGLITLLVAADVLSAGGQGASYVRDVVFMSLSGEAFDLLGSRRLLYDLQRGTNGTAGLDLQRVAAMVEVGMTAAPSVAPGSRAALLLHGGARMADQSAVQAAFVQAGAGADAAPVESAVATALPPSSLLIWRRAAPAADSVYVGDFDAAFRTPFFWGHKDTGSEGSGSWSGESVARAAVTLAQALHALAAGPAGAPLAIDFAAVSALTGALTECLVAEGGLACPLVQAMTSTFQNSAERYVGVLPALTEDDQDPNAAVKNNVERFVWEFLANRTHVGEPHAVTDAKGAAVGCDPTENRCPASEVCLHLHPDKSGKEAQGMCVRATARYSPAYSTELQYVTCGEGAPAECAGGWQRGSLPNAATWAAGLQLPEDPIWTETFNEPIYLRVALRDAASRDGLVLGLGLGAMLAAGTGVFVAKHYYRQHLKRL